MPGDPAPARRGWSLWAIGAIACAAIPVPPPCLLAILLGVIARFELRRHVDRRGRILALVAIGLGLLWTVAWVGGGVLWHRTVRRPLLEGPRHAIFLGQAGDTDGFRDAFVSAPDADARVFLDEMVARYGLLRATAQDPARAPSAVAVDRTRPVLPYVFTFEVGDHPAWAAFVMRDADGLVARFAWVAVEDPVQGMLVFPESSRPEAEAAERGAAGSSIP